MHIKRPKKFKMTTINFILGILAGFIILLILWFLSDLLKLNSSINHTNTTSYSAQIKRLGAAAAYDNLKSALQKMPSDSQHRQAHLFGESLYYTKGLSAITVCDSEFNFGCFHSLIGTALAKEGIAKVEEINNYCATLPSRSNFLICQHGIGHGLIAYFGYDPESLNKALNVCNGLKDKDPIGGCFTGVFMEFNFQTMLSTDGKTRKMSSSSPLFPCNSLKEEFRQPCYYVQVDWWMKVLSGDKQVKIEKIADFCSSLSPDEQTACILGIGSYNTTWTDWNIEDSKQNCRTLTKTDAQILCLSSTAAAFSQNPHFKKQVEALCDSLGNSRNSCRNRAGI